MNRVYTVCIKRDGDRYNAIATDSSGRREQLDSPGYRSSQTALESTLNKIASKDGQKTVNVLCRAENTDVGDIFWVVTENFSE